MYVTILFMQRCAVPLSSSDEFRDHLCDLLRDLLNVANLHILHFLFCLTFVAEKLYCDWLTTTKPCKGAVISSS